MAKRQAKTKSKRTARGGAHGGFHRPRDTAAGATVILLNPGASITLPSGDVILAPPARHTPLP